MLRRSSASPTRLRPAEFLYPVQHRVRYGQQVLNHDSRRSPDLRLTVIGGQRCPRAGCCVASVVPVTPSTAICSGLFVHRGRAHSLAMGNKSRETLYGSSVRAAAERATHARKDADRLACEAWNKRMLGFQGPAQPSPTLGDAINAGFGYLEVKCLGCNTHQTVVLDIVRRPKTTPVHELERYMRCKAGLSVQEKPSSCAADDQDFGERSAVALVAG
jgi:hypothetical protein